MSPNWGYHTNPVTAFLLTLFNARLGWWLLNPRAVAEDGLTGPREAKRRKRLAPSPTVAISELMRELRGRTGDTSRYVYLSDGGHFDNMGLYELVRRRVRFVIVSDAEQDENGKFELKGLPPGTYTIEAWHEKLGPMTQSVTIAAKDSKEVNFTFKAPAAATN